MLLCRKSPASCMVSPVGPSTVLTVICAQLCLCGWYSQQLSPAFASSEACPSHIHWTVVVGVALGAFLLGGISTYLYLWVRAATSGALAGVVAGATVVAVSQSCQTETASVSSLQPLVVDSDDGVGSPAPFSVQPRQRSSQPQRRSLVVRELRGGRGAMA